MAWDGLLAFAGSAIGVIYAARVATRDLALRRRIETTRRFLDLVAVALARPGDGRSEAGVAEQLAAVHLVSDLATADRLLHNAARAGLVELASWESREGDDASIQALTVKVGAAAGEVLNRLDHAKSRSWSRRASFR